jgi:DNA-binding response OmpR family regulator
MSNARILLVEDDALLAPALKRALEQMGYAVAHMPTAAEAMDHAFQHRPDAIVMDVNLGRGIDGIDTARAIRRAYDIPIVFLTSRVDETTRARATLATPAAYLPKSCSAEELRDALESAMRRAAE